MNSKTKVCEVFVTMFRGAAAIISPTSVTWETNAEADRQQEALRSSKLAYGPAGSSGTAPSAVSVGESTENMGLVLERTGPSLADKLSGPSTSLADICLTGLVGSDRFR